MLAYLYGYLAVATLALASEPHVDCSSWTGAAVVEFEVNVVALDGTKFKTAIEMQPNTTPTHVRDIIEVSLKGSGWSVRPVAQNILIIEGYKASPVMSLEFKSVVWKPSVLWTPLPPPKK